MGRESNLWKYLKRGMGRRWDAQRHEDDCAEGIPDVSYGMHGVNGWIELKALPAYPKRKNTKIRVDHFTDAQRRWLTNRGKAGGLCWVLLQVEHDYYLIPWFYAWEVGNVNREKLREISVDWTGTLNWDALCDFLSGRLKLETPHTEVVLDKEEW